MSERVKKSPDFPSSHPGEILKFDIMEPEGISATQLADALQVSRQTVQRLIAKDNPAAVSVSMAQRLEACLGVDAATWLSLQAKYDIWRSNQSPDPILATVRPLAGRAVSTKNSAAV